MVDPKSPPPARPLRVLHLIDGLSGGGSERLLWDTVRLSNSTQIRHFVVTTSPDWFGDFYYADRFRAVGAYPSPNAHSRARPPVFARCLGWLRDFMRKPSPGNLAATIVRFSMQIGALAATFPRSVMAIARHRPNVVHTHTFYGFVHGVFLHILLRVPVVHTVPCLFEQMR